MRESSIEYYLGRQVKKKGGLSIKLVPMFFAGLPDRLVLLPGAKICFIELKAPGKDSRPLQVVVQRSIRKLGFKVFQADTYSSIDTILTEMLGN